MQPPQCSCERHRTTDFADVLHRLSQPACMSCTHLHPCYMLTIPKRQKIPFLEGCHGILDVMRACCFTLVGLQVRQLAATALVSIDARPKPDMESLRQLAVYLEQVLTAHGSSVVQANSINKAVKQAHKALAASASGSYMYI